MEEIFSEGQRRVREKHVSLPYHRPKKHSLEDFLKRRTPVAAVSLSRPTPELQEHLKQIEERQKDAETFYKSEEESDDSEDEDYVPDKEANQNDSQNVSEAVKDNASDENDMNVTNSAETEDEPPCNASNDKSSPIKESCDKIAPTNSLDKESTDAFSLRLTESCVEPNSVEDVLLENSDQFSFKLPDSNEFSQESCKLSNNQCPNGLASSIDEALKTITDDLNSNAASSTSKPNIKPIPEKAIDIAVNIIDSSKSDELKRIQDEAESAEDKNSSSSCRTLFNAPEVSEESAEKLAEERMKQGPDPLPESDPTFSLHLEESQDGLGNQVKDETTNVKTYAIAKENEGKNKEESADKIDWMDLKGFSDDEFEVEETPKIMLKRGPKEDIILLDETPKPLHSGVAKLMEKFLKHSSYKIDTKGKKKSVPLNIITANKNEENKIDGFSTETLIVPIEEEVSAGPKNEKPGAKLTKLRSTLKDLMVKRRQEDWKKRLQEHKVNEEEDNDDEKSECGALMDDDEDFRPCVTESEDSDLEENDIDLTERKKTKSAFVDDEADEDEEEEEDDDGASDVDNDGNDEESELKKSRKKIVKRDDEDYDGDDDNNDDEDLDNAKNEADDDDDWLQPGQSKMRSQSSPSALTNELTTKTDDIDFNDSKFNFSFEVNKFVDNFASESEANTTSNFEVSGLEGLINVKTSTNITESQVLQLCSGRFQTQPAQEIEEEDDNFVLTVSEEKSISQNILTKPSDPLLSSSDEENDVNLTHKRRKKTTLKISDDEDESNELGTKNIDVEDDKNSDVVEEGDGSISNKENALSDIEEDNDNVSVMYDSEENEIQITKKDVGQFFDKEAELSESEWDSEDEDEKGLDRMDEELGDKEEIDEEQVQKELGKIHMRNLLDDDQREINQLKERFLEDGELYSDGKGREKNFKWRNNLNDEALDAIWRSRRNSDCEDVEEEEQGEDESEQLWHKMRQEKEAYLKKNKSSLMRDDEDLDETAACEFTEKFKQTTIRKLDLKKTIDLDEPLVDKMFSPASILQTTNSSMFHLRKGSFLSRSSQILSRVGPISSGTSVESTINQKTKKSRMIFTTVSPTKADSEESQDSNLVNKRKSAPVNLEANKKFKVDEDKKTVQTNRRSLLAQLTSF